MPPRRALVLGGGLSGMAAAWALTRAGWRDVTVVERGSELGGLAGTFEQGGNFYPLAYHHILPLDRPLHFFLDAIGALPRVRWRQVRMLFRRGGALYDLGRPLDFLRFPMSPLSKLRFVSLMLRSFRKEDWSEWYDRDAEELLDRWADAGVREALFDPLTRLKFELPCREVSAAWLGSRLHGREGSKPFGYVPGTNWTKVLCDGLSGLLEEAGVAVRLRTPVVRIDTRGDSVAGLQTASGEKLSADVVVSTVPTEIYRGLVRDESPALASINYTAILSMVCAVRVEDLPDFYWMNLGDLDCQACGLFRLDALNPDIGAPGEVCLNFMTHLNNRRDPRFSRSDELIKTGYLEDFQRIFDKSITPTWSHLSKLSMYSPVFGPGYRNPPIHSSSWRNLYFAGNYRTFPSVVSTGNALYSGLETARAVLQDHDQDSPLAAAAAAFRLPSMPRA